MRVCLCVCVCVCVCVCGQKKRTPTMEPADPPVTNPIPPSPALPPPPLPRTTPPTASSFLPPFPAMETPSRWRGPVPLAYAPRTPMTETHMAMREASGWRPRRLSLDGGPVPIADGLHRPRPYRGRPPSPPSPSRTASMLSPPPLPHNAHDGDPHGHEGGITDAHGPVVMEPPPSLPRLPFERPPMPPPPPAPFAITAVSPSAPP